MLFPFETLSHKQKLNLNDLKQTEKIMTWNWDTAEHRRNNTATAPPCDEIR